MSKHQFLVLLALAEKPARRVDVAPIVRSITNYQIWLHRSSVQSVLEKLLATGLIEAHENLFEQNTYTLTVLGRDKLHREIVLQQAVIHWARRRLDEP